MKLNELLSRKLAASGVRKKDLASHFGLTWSAVHQWFTGGTRPEGSRLTDLFEILGLRNVRFTKEGEVISYEEADPRPLGDSPTREQLAPATVIQAVNPEVTKVDAPPLDFQKLPQTIEERGVAVGGANADFAFNGTVVQYVGRPSGLSSANGIFALRVVSDSMSPRYEPGDLIYVSSLRHPVPGDYVVVELYPETDHDEAPAFIKRLKARGEFYVCEQFNPPGEVRFKRERVRSVFRVFTPNELLGV